MTRRLVFAAAMAAALIPCGRLAAQYQGALISRLAAQRYGLARAWFSQIVLDRARGRVNHVVLSHGTLFVQTDRAMVHALDAQTGETLWAMQVGLPNHPSLVAGANNDLVAVVNGSYLYVLNRLNGKLLWKTQVEGAPGAGAALSDRRAYVPTIQGLIYSYALEPTKDPMAELGAKKRKTAVKETAEQRTQRLESLRLEQENVVPLACQSLGRSLVQPLVTHQDADQEFVAWPTDEGFLFVGYMDRRENRFTVKYRLGTEAGIAARPSYMPPDPNVASKLGVIYAASRDGFVHAIAEKTGDALWRFSTGEPLLEPVAVIGQDLYVATQPGGMFCLNGKTGAQKWWTPGVERFIAAGKGRVYAADKLQQILILDAATGARLDAISGHALPIKVTNTETDRIYVVTDTGLVQCLHEIELTEPLHHGAAPGEAAPGTGPTGLPPAADEEPPHPVANKPPAHAPATHVAPTRPAVPRRPSAKKPAPAGGEPGAAKQPRVPGAKVPRQKPGADDGFGPGGGVAPPGGGPFG